MTLHSNSAHAITHTIVDKPPSDTWLYPSTPRTNMVSEQTSVNAIRIYTSA